MTDIWQRYLEILSDPAHSLVEFTFVLFDMIVIDFVRRRLRRAIKREHNVIDAEHGVENHGAFTCFCCQSTEPHVHTPEQARALGCDMGKHVWVSLDCFWHKCKNCGVIE